MVRPVLISLLLSAAVVSASDTAAQVREMRGSMSIARSPSGWVGITFRSSPAPAEDVTVEDVVEGAPAQRAGILVGDRIIQWNGRSDVAGAIRGMNLQPGDTVRVRVRRQGARDRDMLMVAQRRPPLMGFGDTRELRNALAEVSTRLRMQSDSLRMRADSLRRWAPATPGLDVEEVRRMMTFPGPGAAYDSLMSRFQSGWPDSIGFNRIIEGFEWPIEGNWPGAPWTSFNGFSPPEMTEWMADSIFREFGAGLGVTITAGRSAVAGAELTDVGPGLSSYFGTDEGALVLRIIPGTPSARAGLQEGDVIVAVGGRPIATVSELRRGLGESTNRPVQVEVVRHRERRTLTLGG